MAKGSTSTIFRVRTNFRISKIRNQSKGPTPVNVIIWAMEMLGGRKRGVPVNKIRSLIKKHFLIPCRKQDVDKKIDTALMLAVYFGILKKSDNLYILKGEQSTSENSIHNIIES